MLIGQIETLVDAGVLSHGQGDSLIQEPAGAILNLDEGDSNAGIQKLGAFTRHVDGFSSAGILSQEQGQVLIKAAERIVGQLGS